MSKRTESVVIVVEGDEGRIPMTVEGHRIFRDGQCEDSGVVINLDGVTSFRMSETEGRDLGHAILSAAKTASGDRT